MFPTLEPHAYSLASDQMLTQCLNGSKPYSSQACPSLCILCIVSWAVATPCPPSALALTILAAAYLRLLRIV